MLEATGLKAQVFDVLYNGQQYAVLVGLDVELGRQHAAYFVETLLGTLAPPLLDLQAPRHMAQKRGMT